MSGGPEDFAETVKKNAKNTYTGTGAGKPSGSTDDPDVYMGTRYSYNAMDRKVSLDRIMSASEAAGMYYDWDQKTRDKFLTQLGLAGYKSDQMTDSDLALTWANYVNQAAKYRARGQNLTPWDVLAKDMAQRETAAAKPRTITQTSTSYDLSSKGDAQAIFLTAAQQLIGRDPTKAETAKFTEALNAYERANPRTTTTTSRYAAGGDLTSQSSTTSGGVGEGARQILAMEDIKKDPEYGAYQAATTYFDAMMEMIGGG